MGMVAENEKQLRAKQVNVRLNSEDRVKFEYLKKRLRRETVSYTVRELLRTGYAELSKMKNEDIERVIRNLPPESADEVKELQLNVRLNSDEFAQTEELMEKMKVNSVSKVIRNLIAIYHFTLAEQESQQRAAR